VEVLSGNEHLSLPNDQELDMLDLLPSLPSFTRLACQIRLRPSMDGLLIRLVG
jgi:2Fe-2S ferredoxin